MSFKFPKLSFNLMSVRKLTKDLNYNAQFSDSICKFQDTTSEMRIGNTKEHGGLYYFKEDFSKNKQALTAVVNFFLCLENKK